MCVRRGPPARPARGICNERPTGPVLFPALQRFSATIDSTTDSTNTFTMSINAVTSATSTFTWSLNDATTSTGGYQWHLVSTDNYGVWGRLPAFAPSPSVERSQRVRRSFGSIWDSIRRRMPRVGLGTPWPRGFFGRLPRLVPQAALCGALVTLISL